MTQTCADPPPNLAADGYIEGTKGIQWTASARESTQRFYVDGGKPQEAYMKCNACNGIWTETKQIVDMSQESGIGFTMKSQSECQRVGE